MSAAPDRWESWINPILIRTLRQGLRSKAFLGIYILALVSATLAAVLAALAGAAGGEGGRALFVVAVIAWLLAAWLGQPLVALAAVHRERSDDTWDLVELTGMRPRAVVLGFLGTALVQAAVVGAGLAPFLVISYLLRGVDLGMLLMALVWIPIGTVLLAAVAVFVGCLGRARSSRTTLSALFGLGLIPIAGFGGTFLCTDELGGEVALALAGGGGEPWLILVAVLTAIAAAWLLATTLAATLMTHPAQDRSSAPRAVALAIWLAMVAWLGIALIWAVAYHPGDIDDILGQGTAGAAIGGTAWALLVGLFAVTEAEEPTRRQAAPAAGWWRRLGWWALGPGAPRGRRFLLVLIAANLALLSVGFIAEAGWKPYPAGAVHVVDTHEGMAWVVAGLTCYGLLWLGPLAWALRAAGGRLLTSPAALRAGLLILLAGWAMVGGIAVAAVSGWQWDHAGPLAVLAPHLGIAAMVEDDQHGLTALRLSVLAIGAASLAVLILRCRQRGAAGRLTADPAGRRGEG